ncbi:hypothetical protein [Siphonobacter aquaeclarae]|uniref:Uncharacterized protein n=1 Tax=Siphonobacter aquaeclarae TaxID=563176 RepID=A0A1G9XNY7_9BACT|nr:hypothetical protein [Siphonobacter aquaeclarae]SDM97933.1 hypothetical protein SAMN04488090_4679 [Siphonobacter aquaeclarae]
MRNIYLILAYAICLSSNTFGQQPVHIRARETGQGILKSRNGECFVIAPLHVVEKESKPVEIRGRQNTLSKALFIGTYQLDLGLLRITEGEKQNCENWDIASDFDKSLNETYEGILETIQENGSSKAIKVFLNEKDETYITIRPSFPNDKIIKGMSGSSLFILANGKRVYLGMLMEVDTENKGIVLRADIIDKTLSSFFSSGKVEHNASSPPLPSYKSITERGFRFDFAECKKNGSSITCKLFVTSEIKDSKILIIANYYENSARIYDQNGMEFRPEYVRLGNQTETGQVGWDYTLVKGVKAPLEFKFNEIPDDTKGISLFRFVIEIPDQGISEIKFRNLQFAGLSDKFLNPLKKGIQSREDMGLDIQLMECIRNGSSAVCRLLVKSNVKDQKVRFIAQYYENSARLYDQQGQEYFSHTISLGNSHSDGIVGQDYTLVQNIQTPLEIKFDEVQETAKGASLLRLIIESENNRSEVKFYAIPFSDEKAYVPAPPVKGIKSSNINGLDFQLLECKRNGDNLVCRLVVKSPEKDRIASFVVNYYQFTARVIGDNGVDYKPTLGRIGTKTGEGTIGQNYYLVRNVQTELEFTFGNFPESVKSVALLRFFFSFDNSQSLPVEFSKIPVI